MASTCRPRPPWRGRLALVFCAVASTVQVGFALNGYRDPHKFFAFQPFGESSTWSADIVRVTWEGERLSVEGGWAGYRWDELVHLGGLQEPFDVRDASRGVGSTLDFLDAALDSIALHTPADVDTRYLEATVTHVRNTRGPSTTILRSVERPRP